MAVMLVDSSAAVRVDLMAESLVGKMAGLTAEMKVES
jgi:hypothetical protein